MKVRNDGDSIPHGEKSPTDLYLGRLRSYRPSTQPEFAVSDTPSTPPLIPRSILFGNPIKANPTISPDGTKLAYRAPVDGVMNVWIGDIGSDAFHPVTSDTERGITFYHWAYDSRQILYIQDRGGDENYRLYATDIDTRETRELTPFEDVRVQFIARDRHHPDDMLIGINKENPQLHDVYNLHLPSGELRMVAKNPGAVIDWTADRDLRVRAAMVARPDGGYDLLVRPDQESEWTTLVQWDQSDALGSRPIGFTRDGRHLYMSDARNANAARLVRIDVETGDSEVIAEDPQFDVMTMVVDPETYEATMVAFNRDRVEWVALDDSVRADLEALRAIHSGDFFIVSRDTAERTWIVAYTVDDGPVVWYSYDRSSRTGTFIFSIQPELEEYTLAKMEPISFTSRDGLTIHGYISVPPGVERKSLPMVLDVHGGPWARDTWGYNPEAQWFANRGYVCLQVNYRGSTGYGKDFLNAGDREWAGRMHDDLIDAVEWAIAQGWVDRDRVAIYGGSYGGYAALVGATFTPDVFRCAIDIVGPSSLITLIRSVPPYWKPLIQQFHQRVGNPDTEEEFLKSRSPLYRVDQISIPMMVVQGANDPRVKQAEAEQVVAAMRERDIDHEYLLFEDEGHGFVRPENRMEFYAAAEKFLAEHLGGRVEQ